MRTARAFTLLCSMIILYPSAAYGAYIIVPTDQPTIQAGIDAASAGDVVLVTPGTYPENIDFLGKAITVRSDADGDPETLDIDFDTTIIDGGQAGSTVIFQTGEGPDSVLSGFKITNGSGTLRGDYFWGGGVHAFEASPTISFNNIIENEAYFGGGIGCLYSNAVIFTNMIDTNSAEYGGGGVEAMEFNGRIEGNAFIDNYAAVHGGGLRVVVSHDGPQVVNNYFTGNISAGYGGGIYTSYSVISFIHNTIVGNSDMLPYSPGGGIFIGSTSPVVTITNCIIWGNTPNQINDNAFYDPDVTYSDVEGGWPGEGNIDTNPNFADAEYRIHCGTSPCMNAGDSEAENLPETDRDGNPRICDDAVDMGAYECCDGPYCTDIDGDGYALEGGECGLVDCNDTDTDVHPEAAEAANGVDDDCDCVTDEGFVDSDSDCLVDEFESTLETDPDDPDTDDDGLWDGWEVLGFYADGTDDCGAGDCEVNVDIPNDPYFADPLHKDIFVEVDWMGHSDDPVPHDHRPNQEALDRVVAAFANSPVQNPDGSNGIHLIVEVEEESIPHVDPILSGSVLDWDWTNFDNMKAQYFNPEREKLFHYCIFAHHLVEGPPYSGGSRSIPGKDLIVSLGGWSNSVGTMMEQAGTFMHELGHNLDLRHGGDEDINHKPNYLSIMNYAFQVRGIFGRLDYSRAVLPVLHEISLDEFIGLGLSPSSTNRTIWYCYHMGSWLERIQNPPAPLTPIDWDCDLSFEAAVTTSINRDQAYDILFSYNDWENLTLAHISSVPTRKVTTDEGHEEITYEEAMEQTPWDLPPEYCDGFDNDDDGDVDEDYDPDGDEKVSCFDNCPDEYNPEQEDLDRDGWGDVCDPDADGDEYMVDEDDCDDMNPDVNPGMQGQDCSNAPDGIDNDCDGQIDEDECGCFIRIVL